MRLNMRSKQFLRFFVALDAALFGAGIFGPSMKVIPHYGELTGIVRVFKPHLGETKELSLLSGLLSLLDSQEYFIAVVIALFSVVFPLWKLGAIWSGIENLDGTRPLSRELRFIERLGKFSMLDVYLLACVFAALKALPGGSQIHLRWGLVAFTLSVLLSVKLIQVLEQLSLPNERLPDSRPEQPN